MKSSILLKSPISDRTLPSFLTGRLLYYTIQYELFKCHKLKTVFQIA